MKLGISTYSLYQALQAGTMDIEGVLEYMAEIGAEHAEIVPLGFNLTDKPELIEVIRRKAESLGLELSNYAIGSSFADLDEAAYQAEIARVKREVDIAAALGVKLMRHDAAFSEDVSIGHFLRELPRIADACRQIADYAAAYGITTSVENHGYFIQHSDRVRALVEAVDRPNYKTTLDIGNCMCADENSAAAVTANIDIASMVHVKDFYLRPSYRTPGEGWFPTTAGNWLRGAMAGHGDIDMPEVLRRVKKSGYDGYISIEFEGMEECRQGTRLSFENVKRIWNEIG